MAKLATGRVQDWIDSVINPVLSRVQRASRFLPHGPWEIHPNSLRFETIARVPDAVLVIYHDNLDDFRSHRKRFGKLFDAYDASIEALERSVRTTFEFLIAQPATSGATEGPDDWKFICSYAAANFTEIPGSWFNAKLYNETLGVGLRNLASEQIASSERAGSLAEKRANALITELVKERRNLADTYGARVKPVEFALG